jgi:hypothetical protein
MDDSAGQNSPLLLAAPFIANGLLAIAALGVSKIIDKRVEKKANDWKLSRSNAVSLVEWAIDVSQAAASFVVPLLGFLEITVRSHAPQWLPFLYGAVMVVGFYLVCYAVSRDDPVDYMDRLWFRLPFAATIGFLVNIVACVAVLFWAR